MRRNTGHASDCGRQAWAIGWPLRCTEGPGKSRGCVAASAIGGRSRSVALEISRPQPHARVRPAWLLANACPQTCCAYLGCSPPHVRSVERNLCAVCIMARVQRYTTLVNHGDVRTALGLDAGLRPTGAARICVDPNAREAAEMVSRFLVSVGCSGASTDRTYARTHFTFDTPADMRLRANRVAGTGRPRFLVREIAGAPAWSTFAS